MHNNSSISKQPNYALLTLITIGLVTALRVTHLFDMPFDLFFDEAQYWLWSQSPDWGYYSKPPIVAWTITITTTLFNNSEPFIKLGSPLYHGITAWLIYLSATHLYNKHIGFWSAATYITLPAVTLSSSLISTDPALLCFWAASFLCFLKARDTNRIHWWLAAGITAGLGMLSKYNMILFLPSVLLALYQSPKHKHYISQKEIWIASAITLALFIPNILWNADNGFVSFLHTKDNVNLQSGNIFHPAELIEFLTAQFGIFGPILTTSFIIFLFKRKTNPLVEDKTLLSFIWPLLAVITVISLLSRAHANWAVPIYITATILVTAWLIQNNQHKWVKISIALHIIVTLLFMYSHHIISAANIELSGKRTDLTSTPITIKDPYKRIRGWKAMSRMVKEIADKYPNSIIISDERKIAAPLHYYINGSTTNTKKHTIVKWNMNGHIEDHYELIDSIDNYPNHNALYVTRINNPGITKELGKTYKKTTLLETITIPLYKDYNPRYAIYYLEK